MLTFISCGNNSTNKTITIEAETYMKGTMVEADKWFKIFNEIGYKVLLNQNYPLDIIFKTRLLY